MAQIFGERWQIKESLNEGGQAHTFIVEDTLTGDTNWVLKRLKNSRRLGRFQQEVNALQKLDFPRIPKVEDYSLEDPAYIVYRHIPGKTLQRYILDDNPVFDEVFDLFRDVVEAVAQAHLGDIVHRDIKPDNVIVDSSSPKRRAHLIDFGICQADENGVFVTTVDEAFGNRSFAAPEFEIGSDIASGPLSDVYGLGRLLFWSITGGRLFLREDFESQIERVPQPRGVERAYVRRLLQKSIQANPASRVTAYELQKLAEVYGTLMRQGVPAVGSPNQLCPTCRLGHLSTTKQVKLGIPPVGNLPSDSRILVCNYCGYIQLHQLSGTHSLKEGLWEI